MFQLNKPLFIIECRIVEYLVTYDLFGTSLVVSYQVASGLSRLECDCSAREDIALGIIADGAPFESCTTIKI